MPRRELLTAVQREALLDFQMKRRICCSITF
jgi:hypothetical protein